MLFWILTVVIVLVWVGLTVYMFREDWPLGLGMFFLGGICAGLIWVLVVVGGAATGLNYLVGANRVESETVQLKALGSDSSVEGRFYFLGGGHVDGKRVLSYIRVNADGSFTPDQVDGAESRVHESDTSAPELVTHTHIADHWWVSPAMPLFEMYEFTVPTGSVAEGYSVTP